jgi:hypothetical protein
MAIKTIGSLSELQQHMLDVHCDVTRAQLPYNKVFGNPPKTGASLSSDEKSKIQRVVLGNLEVFAHLREGYKFRFMDGVPIPERDGYWRSINGQASKVYSYFGAFYESYKSQPKPEPSKTEAKPNDQTAPAKDSKKEETTAAPANVALDRQFTDKIYNLNIFAIYLQTACLELFQDDPNFPVHIDEAVKGLRKLEELYRQQASTDKSKSEEEFCVKETIRLLSECATKVKKHIDEMTTREIAFILRIKLEAVRSRKNTTDADQVVAIASNLVGYLGKICSKETYPNLHKVNACSETFFSYQSSPLFLAWCVWKELHEVKSFSEAKLRDNSENKILKIFASFEERCRPFANDKAAYDIPGVTRKEVKSLDSRSFEKHFPEFYKILDTVRKKHAEETKSRVSVAATVAPLLVGAGMLSSGRASLQLVGNQIVGYTEEQLLEQMLQSDLLKREELVWFKKFLADVKTAHGTAMSDMEKLDNKVEVDSKELVNFLHRTFRMYQFAVNGELPPKKD